MSAENPFSNRPKPVAEVAAESAEVSSEGVADWARDGAEVSLTLRSKAEGVQTLLKTGGSFEGALVDNVVVGSELRLDSMVMGGAGRVADITSEGNGVFAVRTEDGAVYELKKALPKEEMSAPTEAAAPVEALDVSEPFPTAEATRERFPDLPKEFEKIVITKTAIKEGQTSSVAAGAVYEGVLLGDIAEGMSLATTAVSTGKIERDGITQVGPGEFQIETGTSTYRIKKAS